MKSVFAAVYVTAASLSVILFSSSCPAQVPSSNYHPARPGYTGGGTMLPDPIEEEKQQQANRYYDEGVIQRKKKNYASAIAAFQKSLPRRSDTYQELGDLYTITGQNDKAMETYHTVIYSVGISRSDLYLKYALLLHQSGQYDEALMNYQKGLEDLQDNYLHVNINIEVNRQNMATKQLVAGAHLALAVYYLGGDYEESTRHCAEVLRIKPNYGGAYLCLARALARVPLRIYCLFGKKPTNAALHKAEELGTGPVREAARKRLAEKLIPENEKLLPDELLVIPSAEALLEDPVPNSHPPAASNTPR